MTTNPNESSQTLKDGYQQLSNDKEYIEHHAHRDGNSHLHSHSTDEGEHEHSHSEEEHSHSHSLEVSHLELEALLNTRFNNLAKKQKNLGEEFSEVSYEESWSHYTIAKQNVVIQTMDMLARTVHVQLPEAKFIVLYEDHSHDAPHGHIESFLDESGHTIDLGEDWHDVPWGTEVDELVWDIYNLAKEHFVTSGDKRRLVVEV